MGRWLGGNTLRLKPSGYAELGNKWESLKIFVSSCGHRPINSVTKFGVPYNLTNKSTVL